MDLSSITSLFENIDFQAIIEGVKKVIDWFKTSGIFDKIGDLFSGLMG